MTDDRNEQDVAFGFRRVGEGEKQGLVNEVFSKVAERYDQMNDLMSGGLHRLWKDDFVAMLNPPRGQSAFNHLDVAGGTGDIAFRILRSGGPNVRVTVADISPEMVGEGRERAETDGLLAVAVSPSAMQRRWLFLTRASMAIPSPSASAT